MKDSVCFELGDEEPSEERKLRKGNYSLNWISQQHTSWVEVKHD